MSPLDRARRAFASIVRAPRRLALAWALVTFAALATLSAGPGVSADEAVVLAAAEGAGPPPPAGARPALPPAAAVARATHAAARRAGLPHLVSWRLGSALAGALLSAFLALFAFELAGPSGALLAPALYWLAPRQLLLGAIATPDTAAAALWLATAWAYRRAVLAAGTGSARPAARSGLAYAAIAGVAFGGALAMRLDAWVLLAALALHASVTRLLRRPEAPADGVGVGVSGRGGVLPVLGAMAVLGALALLARWPSGFAELLMRAQAPRASWSYLGARLSAVRPPLAYPLVVTALTVPGAVLLSYLGGVADAVARAVRGWRGDRAIAIADELLLLAAAAAPIVAAALGIAPPTTGVRPWLPAFPFLALLGARALLAAARAAWPSRGSPLALALALLVLYPALRQTLHAWPAGGAAWNELAGGAPGAASLGMQRQDGGEAAAAVLDELEARARPGARVHFAGAAPEAIRIYRADGRLRADLEPVDDPERADLAVVTLDGGSRDAEYRIWSAFRTARPSSAVFLDEVPLVHVYARPGAWR